MTSTSADLTRVRSAKYVLLTTFRRDGTPVPTPVWAVPVETGSGPGLRIWTSRETGKVKRIRAGARVTVAPCTMRGRPTGPAVEGAARLLDRAGTLETLHGLRARYGIVGRLLTRSAMRHVDDAIGIEVALG